jgi:hypothetical protein
VVVMSKIMLHTGNHVAEITPNDVVDYHGAAARCAMVYRWLAGKYSSRGSASASLAFAC